MRWLWNPFTSALRRSPALPSSPTEARIDRMHLGDLDQILAIERASFPTPWSRASFVSELTDNIYSHYLVARLGDRLAGYAGMWIILDEAHITNVAVHPDFRGQRVGDRLMGAVVEVARRWTCRTISLEVRRTNAVAQHLYANHGFVHTGVRKAYYSDNQEDAFIMVCTLHPATGEEGDFSDHRQGPVPAADPPDGSGGGGEG